MTNEVFITGTGQCLPNDPVSNDHMEAVLGQIGPRPSRARRIILRNNGIKSRHYVLDPATGQPLFNNAQITAEAVRSLFGEQFGADQLSLLCCGTSTPDQLMPNHGVMVHGELGSPPCEVIATSGICTAGMTALKYGYMAVAAGEHETAVSTGSEVVSTFMRASSFTAETEARIRELEQKPEIAFEKDFLRWMLSDGAGAVLMRNQPAASGISLRIDWIDVVSFANELPACMYAGARKEENGRLTGWREYPSQQAMLEDSALAIKQDVKLLNANVVPYTVGKTMQRIMAKRPELKPTDFDWFLPHYSSAYFRQPVADELTKVGFEIPQERWFTNLSEVGNVGAGSMYLMLHGLMNGGGLRDGQRVLCYIPESGRFSSVFMALTVVA